MVVLEAEVVVAEEVTVTIVDLIEGLISQDEVLVAVVLDAVDMVALPEMREGMVVVAADTLILDMVEDLVVQMVHKIKRKSAFLRT